MRVFKFLFAVSLIITLISGCMSVNVKEMDTFYSKVPQTNKELYIPKYKPDSQFKERPFVYWHFCKLKQSQLGLVSPETSKDNLIFRVWVTNTNSRNNQPHGLLEIKKDSSKWVAQLTLMYVDFKLRTLNEKIGKRDIYDLQPKNMTWEAIIDSLYKLNFNELPTDEEIPGYYYDNSNYANNLPTFSFEYADVNTYRFYQYNNIYRAPDKVWQAKNVISILDLLEEEFEWNTRGYNYFESK